MSVFPNISVSLPSKIESKDIVDKSVAIIVEFKIRSCESILELGGIIFIFNTFKVLIPSTNSKYNFSQLGSLLEFG